MLLKATLKCHTWQAINESEIDSMRWSSQKDFQSWWRHSQMCIRGIINLRWSFCEMRLIIDKARFDYLILIKYKSRMILNPWSRIEIRLNRTFKLQIKEVWWPKLRFIQTCLKWERINYSQLSSSSKMCMKFQRILIESLINRKGNLSMLLKIWKRLMKMLWRLKRNSKRQLLLKKTRTNASSLFFQYCVW